MTRPTGRPRGLAKPTELKILTGNPGKRSLRGKVPGAIPSRAPAPPPHLGDAGREAWGRYWSAGAVWLALSDVDAVTQLCELHDQSADIRERINAEGLLVVSENTGRSFVHNAYNDLRGVRAEMRQLWSSLYMTPTDRARANLEPPKDDPVADWEASA